MHVTGPVGTPPPAMGKEHRVLLLRQSSVMTRCGSCPGQLDHDQVLLCQLKQRSFDVSLAALQLLVQRESYPDTTDMILVEGAGVRVYPTPLVHENSGDQARLALALAILN